MTRLGFIFREYDRRPGLSAAARLILVLLFVANAGAYTAFGQPTVLVLNSYHPGYVWSDSIVAGIRSVLSEPSHRLRLEYMDAKYMDPETLDPHLTSLYERKYGTQVPDVVVATDIVAAGFLERHHDSLFPGVPSVFATVHDLPRDAPEGQWWTATSVDIPVAETLELMMGLHPNLDEVLVIAEDTDIGRALQMEVKAVAATFGPQVAVRSVTENSVDRLLRSIGHVSSNGAVLYTLVSHDAGGLYVPPDESLGNLVEQSHVPFYSFFDMYAGLGIAGGALVDGHDLGRRVGEQIKDILSGAAPGDIPIASVGARHLLCDWNQLTRYEIPQGLVPSEAVVINAPDRTLEVPTQVVAMVLTVVALLVAGVTLLVNLVRKQRTTQARLEHALVSESLAAQIAAYLNGLEYAADFSLGPVQRDVEEIIGATAMELLIEIPGDEAHTSPRQFRSGPEYAEGSEASIVRKLVVACGGRPNTVFSSSDSESDEISRQARKAGIFSFVLMQLSVENLRLGWVLYARASQRQWQDSDVDLLSTVSEMLGATWDRFRAEERNQAVRALLERTGRLASIGVVAAGITHEISQPLNYIKMTTDSLRYGTSEAEKTIVVPTRKVGRLAEAVDRIARVVTHMREYWSRPPEAVATVVDIRDAVENALALLRRQVSTHGIELTTTLPEEPLLVRSSAIHIEQIVVNLVGNSIHALDRAEGGEGRIAVTLSVPNGGIVSLVVEDNGPGLPPGDSQRVFDPFYSSKRPDEGMGLGLAIVRSFVEHASGTIEVERSKMGGAAFCVRFVAVQKEERV